MRATLSHVEAALEAREAELHDSWHALRLQAADLQSDSELTPDMLQPDASARVGAQLPPWFMLPLSHLKQEDAVLYPLLFSTHFWAEKACHAFGKPSCADVAQSVSMHQT